MYSETFNVSPVVVLEDEEGRMKMELANMCGLLTSYSFSLTSGVPTKYLFH